MFFTHDFNESSRFLKEINAYLRRKIDQISIYSHGKWWYQKSRRISVVGVSSGSFLTVVSLFFGLKRKSRCGFLVGVSTGNFFCGCFLQWVFSRRVSQYGFLGLLVLRKLINLFKAYFTKFF